MIALLQQPTIPGKVDGIIGWDPCVLQCRECGETATQDRRSVATFIILANFKFHLHEPEPRRLCPSCMDAVRDACENCRAARKGYHR